MAESGLLGALPVFAWSIVIVWLAVRGVRRARGRHVATVRGLVIGLGAVSLVGMPTQDPVVLMAFFLIVAMLATARIDGDSPGAVVADTASSKSSVAPTWLLRGRSLSGAWMFVGVLAVADAGGHVALASGSLAVAERAVRTNRDYLVGLYQEETRPDGGDFQWTRGEAHLGLVKRGAYLTMRAWIQHPDAAERPVTLRIASPCQVLFERALADSSPVDVILRLPIADERIDLDVGVSHTWSPASVGSSDTRRLGAAIEVDFVDSAVGARALPTVVESCDTDVSPPS